MQIVMTTDSWHACLCTYVYYIQVMGNFNYLGVLGKFTSQIILIYFRECHSFINCRS